MTYLICNRVVGAADQYVRLDSYRKKFFDRVLHRFCFKLTVSRNFHDERDMYKENVFAAFFIGNLPDTFKKSLTLYIAYCAADFADNHIGSGLAGSCLLLGQSIYPGFYFLCNMGNYLHRSTQVVTSALP